MEASPKFDLTREYGLVLEGGGAKGSYQIGAWKALREAGVRIQGVAGTSVGSLNGALICMDDLEKAEYIWENISYSQVMDLPDGWMDAIENGGWSSLGLGEILSQAFQLLKDHGLDITPLKDLLDSAIDEGRIRNSSTELYVNTYSVTDRKCLSVDVKQVPEGSIRDMLLASAFLPVFKSEKLQGKKFMDGGGFNNVPVDVLLDRGYKDILVIRIYGLGFDRGRFLKVPEDVDIKTIAPRQNLGGILEFDGKKARRNMRLGYYDAKRLIEGLYGKHYYIRADRTEVYYFDRMMSEMEWILPWLAGLGKQMPDPEERGRMGCRYYTERLFGWAASCLRLKEGWDYKDLYIAMIEHMARGMRVGRFCVYTLDELAQKVMKEAFNLKKIVL